MDNSRQTTLILGGTGRTGSLAGVVLADYGVMLNWLTGMIASGHGSRPNDDVRRVTGSPPASFSDFAHRNARAWAVRAAHP
jgi:hypothetical protein